MAQPIPYLAFDGSCAEAMRFYTTVLGGTLSIMTNRQSPFAAQCAPEHLDRVMHARITFADGSFLYGGDCPPGMPYQGIHGVSIALVYDTVDEAQRVFDSLAEGGAVTMPFAEAFWAKRSGMVKDRFGLHWAINGAMSEIALAAA